VQVDRGDDPQPAAVEYVGAVAIFEQLADIEDEVRRDQVSRLGLERQRRAIGRASLRLREKAVFDHQVQVICWRALAPSRLVSGSRMVGDWGRPAISVASGTLSSQICLPKYACAAASTP